MKEKTEYLFPLFLIVLMIGAFFIISYENQKEFIYDESNDWCNKKCYENGMDKIRYTSKDSQIICHCLDSSSNIIYKVNVFGN